MSWHEWPDVRAQAQPPGLAPECNLDKPISYPPELTSVAAVACSDLLDSALILPNLKRSRGNFSVTDSQQTMDNLVKPYQCHAGKHDHTRKKGYRAFLPCHGSAASRQCTGSETKRCDTSKEGQENKPTDKIHSILLHRCLTRPAPAMRVRRS